MTTILVGKIRPEIVIAKHGNGPIGAARLSFNAAFTSFNNAAEQNLL